MDEKQMRTGAEAVEPEPDAKAARRPRHRGGRGWARAIIGMLLLLVMGGGAALGYRYWHQMRSNLQLLSQVLAQAQHEQAQLQQRIERANELFDAQADRIQEYDRSFQAQREVLVEEVRKLKLQEDAMQQAVAMAQERMGSGSANWMLGEAEYLMRLAQRRLTLDRDVVSAREALTAADQRLRETGDPQWAEVREVLGGEISALRAVPADDLEQAAQLLAALSDEVQGLPLSDGPERQLAEGGRGGPGEPEAAPEQRTLETLIKEGLAGLGSVISVRYHDVPASGLLPPPKQQAVYQNLLLQLDTAQYALLRRDPGLYQGSLAKASAWLNEYFDPASPSTRSFSERLKAAAATNVRPSLPDISTSLRMLQRRREQARQGDGT